MRKHITACLSALILALAVACGGGNTTEAPAPPPVAAKGLAYTDPAGSGWRLVKDASSTSTRLVLNLVGPVGVRSRGVGFNLQAGAKVAFGGFANGWHVRDTGVFQLLNYHRSELFPPEDPEPVFLAAGVRPGNVLTVGVFQKDRLIDAKVVTQPLLQVAVEFDAAKGLAAGDTVPLTVLKARMIPEDLGAMAQDGTYNEAEILAKGKVVDIPLAVGTLKAQ
ncbi:MAG TPA: hypothetical protein VK188_07540 [Holophaga sp.]|nr:hypothetical protein [Holophaga sp.]